MVIAFVMEWVFWLKGGVAPLDRVKVKYATMNRYYDVSKAKERLGWQPKVEWKEGVRRAVEVSFLVSLLSTSCLGLVGPDDCSGISQMKRTREEIRQNRCRQVS